MDKSKVFFSPVKKSERETDVREKVKGLARKSGLLDVISKDDFVGIKLHFGEKGNTGHISPAYVREIARLTKKRSLNTALIETNTIYVGSRSNSISHLTLASMHGFNYNRMSVPVLILDGVTGRDFIEIEVNGKHLSRAKIASGIMDFDCIVSLAHVTGHCQTGLAASLKNIGMGCASRLGKLEQHSKAIPRVTAAKCTGCGLCRKWCPAGAIEAAGETASINAEKCVGCGECIVACRVGAIEIQWNETLSNLQEKMVEYAAAALSGRKRAFMNFLIKITKDCDCMAKDDPRITPDIGMLASEDPVAIDKATTDLLLKHADCDTLKNGYPQTDWKIQLEYAASMGLGNMDYELISI